MKKATLVFSVVALLIASASVTADDSFGSMFGTLTTARPVGMRAGNFGAAIGLGDNATTFSGAFTYGMSANTDIRFKLGLVDADGSDTKFNLGADFKYQMVSVDGVSNGPFDMALGAFFEYTDLDAVSILLLGGQFIGSYPARLSNGHTLSPYGRFNVRLENASFDLPPGFSGDDSESDLEVGISGGVMFDLTNAVDIYGEFQLDGNDGVFLGLDFNIM